MQIARKPLDEQARLAVLRRLEILDTEPEEVFDRITRLASRLLGTPISAVSLIDEQRQWFKSMVGLPVRETPRDWAFCAHVIHGTDAFVVHDAQADDRFLDNPLVTGAPHVRFYAGVPLTSIEGVQLGSLCVIDTRPRAFSAEDRDTLRDLAALVNRELHLREAMRDAHDTSRAARAALVHTRERFRSVFEHAAVGMALLGLDGRWLQVNEALADIVGYAPSELLHLTFRDITVQEDMEAHLSLAAELLTGQRAAYTLEKRYRHAQGHAVWVNIRVSLARDDAGHPSHFIAVVENIQARKEAELALHALRLTLEDKVAERTRALQASTAALLASEAQMRAVLEHANDAYIAIDERGIICEWNQKAEQLFGWTREEALGLPIHHTIIPDEMRGAHQMSLSRTALGVEGSGQVNRRVELTAVTREGRTLPVEVSLGAVPCEGRTLYCAFLHDISERVALQRSLEEQARRDPLTGLPNRRELLTEIPKAMARADRSEQHMAVIFLDLDGFKQINDTLGHEMGDRVLCAFATRLQASVRDTDMVARLAGDEFIVLFEGLYTPMVDEELITLLDERLSAPLELDGHDIPVSASIGMQIYSPGAETTVEELLDRADQAMYEVKRTTRAALTKLAA